jgi:hypothetical protein
VSRNARGCARPVGAATASDNIRQLSNGMRRNPDRRHVIVMIRHAQFGVDSGWRINTMT